METRSMTILFLLLFFGNKEIVESALSELERVEALYEQTDRGDIIRVNTMDVVGDVKFCRTVVMNPFTDTSDDHVEYTTNKESMQYMAAVALALSHLNAGDGSVIPELDGLQCKKKFTLELSDTGFREDKAAKSALSLLDRTHRRPCAFIGSPQTDVTAMVATLTTLREYPHISPISSASKLSNPEQFRYLARLLPPEGGGWDGPDPLLEFLSGRLGMKHLMLAYEDEPSTHAQLAGMVTNAERFFPEMHVKTLSVPKNCDSDQIKYLMKQIKRESYRYVFAAFSGDVYGRIFEAAVQQGIAGYDSSYTWIWANPGVEDYMKGQEFAMTSPTFQAMAGSLLFSRIGSSPEVGRYSAFIKEWESLSENTTDLEYLRSKIPTQDLSVRQALDRYTFIQESPNFSLVPLYYDSAILIGLAACEDTAESFPDGPGHFSSMLNTTFLGASGPIGLTPESRARSQDAAMFRIWNFVPKKTLYGTVKLNRIQVASYTNGSWIEPEEGTRIMFADASFTIPSCLPAVVENRNYIGKNVGKVGFAMTFFLLLLSFAFSKWTLVCRDQRIVRASQPVFLHLICIGTGLMGLSIAVLSFDDESIGNMDLICSAFPILLSLGWCFAFSAILSKTLRINIIFQNPRFKRIRVTPRDVIRPMLFLLSINVILLTAWGVQDPLRWERETILFDEYGRAIESFGFCTSNHAVGYASALLVVNIGVLAVTSFQSYVARRIATEFSESEYIAKAVGVVVLVSFMAIPIYQVSHENTKSRFLAISSSIFVISLSLLLLIFVPKMFYRGKGVKAGIRQSLHFRNSDNDGDKSEDGTRASFDDEEDSSDDSVGVMRITSHPKLYAQLEEKMRITKRENLNLRRLIRELRQSSNVVESSNQELLEAHGPTPSAEQRCTRDYRTTNTGTLNSTDPALCVADPDHIEPSTDHDGGAETHQTTMKASGGDFDSSKTTPNEIDANRQLRSNHVEVHALSLNPTGLCSTASTPATKVPADEESAAAPYRAIADIRQDCALTNKHDTPSCKLSHTENSTSSDREPSDRPNRHLAADKELHDPTVATTELKDVEANKKTESSEDFPRNTPCTLSDHDDMEVHDEAHVEEKVRVTSRYEFPWDEHDDMEACRTKADDIDHIEAHAAKNLER